MRRSRTAVHYEQMVMPGVVSRGRGGGCSECVRVHRCTTSKQSGPTFMVRNAARLPLTSLFRNVGRLLPVHRVIQTKQSRIWV